MIRDWLTGFRDKIFGIQKLEFLLTEEINRELSFKFREQKAIEILKPYFPRRFLFETGFSLNFQTIQHIANDIIIYNPKTILEIGSGISTLILDNFISELDYNPKFISVDQDSNWQLQLKNQTRNVDYFAFDISTQNQFSLDGRGNWFDIPLNSELRGEKYDLVIIDGPKGFESKNARYGVVKFLRNRIGKNSIIFVDDTNRKDERFLCDSLLREFSFNHCDSFYNYSRLCFEREFTTSPS